MSDERKPMANITPFGLRMQPELKARVEEAARANNRSLNAEIVATLEEKYPAPKAEFSYDAFFEAWITPISTIDDLSAKEAMVEEANAYLRAHNPKISVWLSSTGGVSFGFRHPREAATEDIDQAQRYLNPNNKNPALKVLATHIAPPGNDKKDK